MAINKKRMVEIIDNFKNAKILVLGDLILDQFIWGDVKRISPEAPVPVVQVEDESFMPGGMANVAVALSTLQGCAHAIGVIGDDSWGEILKTELRQRKVNVKGIVKANNYKTALKTRIVARHQQVVRVDREKIKEINRIILKKIVCYIEQNIAGINAIIIEDYGKGLIIPELIKEVVSIAQKNNVIVTVDPKEEHFSYYHGVHCLTPNQDEAGKAVGIKISDKTSLLAAGKKLLSNTSSEAVLITRGEHGMCLFEKQGKITHIPTMAQEVFDVSGAGDTVIAVFTLAIACGASFLEAAYISNYAASVVVGKIGVAVCSYEELIDRIFATKEINK
ncbi:MAG: D-glycero-beta-D-manno-heptose-7-phosphate kinase [Candidatus Omnitrophota bacterium]|nr:MAG: D-glycero-beta-D-manno-heptose-7-phosphate kinase [Candidatus Omnitrophota bacterium]